MNDSRRREAGKMTSSLSVPTYFRTLAAVYHKYQGYFCLQSHKWDGNLFALSSYLRVRSASNAKVCLPRLTTRKIPIWLKVDAGGQHRKGTTACFFSTHEIRPSMKLSEMDSANLEDADAAADCVSNLPVTYKIVWMLHSGGAFCIILSRIYS